MYLYTLYPNYKYMHMRILMIVPDSVRATAKCDSPTADSSSLTCRSIHAPIMCTYRSPTYVLCMSYG